jgi:hypothetical protein
MMPDNELYCKAFRLGCFFYAPQFPKGGREPANEVTVLNYIQWRME